MHQNRKWVSFVQASQVAPGTFRVDNVTGWENGYFLMQACAGFPWPNADCPVALVECDHGQEVRGDLSRQTAGMATESLQAGATSYCNLVEASLAIRQAFVQISRSLLLLTILAMDCRASASQGTCFSKGCMCSMVFSKHESLIQITCKGL